MDKNNTTFKIGNIPWNKGKKGISEETREKMRQAKLENPSLYWLGKKRSIEDRKKFSLSHIGLQVGEKNGKWKGGVYGTERHRAMGRAEYKFWRKSIFGRDNYICQICLKKGSQDIKLEADHIKPWALYPELRLAIDNGRTLCVDCHKNVTRLGSRYLHLARDIQI